MYDWLIVGAGFAGSVLAERLASQRNERVLLIDRRPHIGGNAYDRYDDAGLLIHQYGPHIFHTNSPQIVDYLSQFTEWRPYEHRVLAEVDGMLVPIPINLDTINRLYGLDLDLRRARGLVRRARRAGRRDHAPPRTWSSRKVGRELYEKFFRGYTRKQWGLDPSELDKSVTARVPTRTNRDDRYFGDNFQVMPQHGYTRMFERMLDHPNINIMLQTDYRRRRRTWCLIGGVIYTGPIDEYLRLPLRQAALPLAALPARDARPGVAPAGRGRELSRRRTTTPGSPSTST